MRRLSLTLLFLLVTFCTKAQHNFVRLETDKGNITLMLYDATPNHKAMFLNAVKNGTYNNAHFNRVIKDFVSQAGELDEPILAREKLHPEIKPKRLAAELDSNLIHKKGALGAGRDDNPNKSSYFNQIYLVSGKLQTDAMLDATEKRTGRKISAAHREVYKTFGGTPHLDMDYTLFGEIVEGQEVADAINKVATDKSAVPLTPIIFNAFILSKKEVKSLTAKLKL
ncbi:cyclophilin family peptidyl-prolyl cis-trans isomerase [Pedobacter sp. UYP24]